MPVGSLGAGEAFFPRSGDGARFGVVAPRPEPSGIRALVGVAERMAFDGLSEENSVLQAR